jgi:hypothetical protein
MNQTELVIFTVAGIAALALFPISFIQMVKSIKELRSI